MKAVSVVTTKPSRNTVYSRPPAKRVSSAIHPLQPIQSSPGVAKTRTKSQASPRRSNVSRSPSSLITLELQRQRQQQIIALEREVRGLLEEEYREDVKRYMHQMELATMSSASSIDMQPELQWHMRGCLVDFLIEVHLTFRLRPETLYLTCNIVDRYVSRRVVYKKHYQLVGCAALWIAAKFEDAKERVPTVQDLREICRDAYDETAFIQMEGHVLATIAWRIGHPTAEAWLRMACCDIYFEDQQTQHVARFLMEITLFRREFIGFLPSVIATAALHLARFALGKQRRPFEDDSDAMMTVVLLLDALLAEHIDEVSDTLVKKYSYSYYSKASTHVVQFYLRGCRYVHQPAALPIPLLPPVTPTNKIHRSSFQSWPSASSSVSSTPSFSGSDFTDFSSDTEDSLPITPLTPNFAASPASAGDDPLAMFSAFGVSSNKENLVPGGGPTAERARDGKLDDDMAMDVFGPSPSQLPRAALHSLMPNSAPIA